MQKINRIGEMVAGKRTAPGPDDDALRQHVQDGLNDTEIGRMYGVSRQVVGYRRLTAGLVSPGSRSTRPRVSHKDTIPWTVKASDANRPIRKRLVDLSLRRQGIDIAPDANARLDDFLQFLKSNEVVVTYDHNHVGPDGEPAPFYFVPRSDEDDPNDVIRQPEA